MEPLTKTEGNEPNSKNRPGQLKEYHYLMYSQLFYRAMVASVAPAGQQPQQLNEEAGKPRHYIDAGEGAPQDEGGDCFIHPFDSIIVGAVLTTRGGKIAPHTDFLADCRLWKEVREARGLAYSVSSSMRTLSTQRSS